jgi:hypothetical protein
MFNISMTLPCNSFYPFFKFVILTDSFYNIPYVNLSTHYWLKGNVNDKKQLLSITTIENEEANSKL